MTPHMEAIAFRIWQVAEPVGWDLTLPDASRRAGIHPTAAVMAMRRKGWLSRFRATETDRGYYIQGRPSRAAIFNLGWDQ